MDGMGEISSLQPASWSRSLKKDQAWNPVENIVDFFVAADTLEVQPPFFIGSVSEPPLS